MLHKADSLGSFRLQLISIHGSFSILTMFQKPRGDRTFSEGLLCLERQKLVPAWDQRTERKVASDGSTQLPQHFRLLVL